MNDFPPELHSYIFRLACTDDGRTIKALSLVSSYYHNIALPLTFHSLAISGLERITELASKLEKLAPHLRTVRHLFISDQSNRELDKHQPGSHCCNSESIKIMRILTLAAPTLVTLTFAGTCPSTSTSLIARLFRFSFPHLRELVISGYYPFPSVQGNFPKLERLHLIGNRNPHGLLQLGGLDGACPSLTHLRVSGIMMARNFAQELQEAFHGDETALFPAKLPPCIEYVIVQTKPSLPLSEKCAAASVHGQLMVEQLVAVTAKATQKGARFTLLQRSDSLTDSDLVKQHWLDRLDGGSGCWEY